MNPFFRFLKKCLPHLTLIFSLMMLTFFIIDSINPSMAFLGNSITKTLLCIFSVLTLILSLLSILRDTSQH